MQSIRSVSQQADIALIIKVFAGLVYETCPSSGVAGVRHETGSVSPCAGYITGGRGNRYSRNTHMRAVGCARRSTLRPSNPAISLIAEHIAASPNVPPTEGERSMAVLHAIANRHRFDPYPFPLALLCIDQHVTCMLTKYAFVSAARVRLGRPYFLGPEGAAHRCPCQARPA